MSISLPTGFTKLLINQRPCVSLIKVDLVSSIPSQLGHDLGRRRINAVGGFESSFELLSKCKTALLSFLGQ
ncbi:hypothetical protein MEA186_32922 [Mesorhizobium amorphae CCNWGS0123]|uniref:Uncharacterized protein n=1 Tax=Mesorhizobium amorphae CCNWGS0123 TaxID=1082933 RepID=G6YKP9_9HYPH|nr:hypothetical protein MEA186_32922 [Mesorhizobium amorphae CCNWGS0123]